MSLHTCLRWYTQLLFLNKHPYITCFSMVSKVEDVVSCSQKNVDATIFDVSKIRPCSTDIMCCPAKQSSSSTSEK